MPIDITITGLTPAQQQEIADAVEKVSPIPLNPDGTPMYTKAKWIKMLLLRHLKAIVMGARRQDAEAALATAQQSTEADYGDDKLA